MFSVQIIGTVVTCIVNLLTAIYLMDTVPNICTSKNIEWRCPLSTTFYSASVIWGAIGISDVLFCNMMSIRNSVQFID